MKDKSSLRLVLIGFLSGIVFSGLVLISFNIIQVHQQQKSTLLITPVSVIRLEKEIVSNKYSRLDLNLASLDELTTLPGIGETKAKAIIEYREKYGFYEEITELKYVPGIGNSLYNSIQDLVIINLD